MLYGTNFPEGFCAGMSLRGFHLGTTRQLLSPLEQSDLENIRSKIACILADCGFQEAANACRRPATIATVAPAQEPKAQAVGASIQVEGIVREVMEKLRTRQRTATN